MQKKMKRIMETCIDLGIPKGKLTEEYLFTVLGVDLFFYNSNI